MTMRKKYSKVFGRIYQRSKRNLIAFFAPLIAVWRLLTTRTISQKLDSDWIVEPLYRE
jgi:hypothetical protein